MVRMMLMAFALLAVPMAACSGPSAIPPPPLGVVTIDETVGTTLTNAYTLASKAAALGIQTGAISDRATIERIGQVDNRLYGAIMTLRSAQQAGNAADWLAARRQAEGALKQLRDLLAPDLR